MQVQVQVVSCSGVRFSLSRIRIPGTYVGMGVECFSDAKNPYAYELACLAYRDGVLMR